MVPLIKSTKDFELFESLNPGTVRVNIENSKAEVILARCAILGPATALVRFNAMMLAWDKTTPAVVCVIDT